MNCVLPASACCHARATRHTRFPSTTTRCRHYRFDFENDALLYFDDVKVPWDRVFVHRDTDMCRAQFHDTPGHVFQNYQAQIRLSVKLKFLVGLAHKITEAIGTTNMPQVREQLGALAAHATVVESMVYGMEAAGSMRGEFYLPNRHMVYAAHVTTQDLYPRLINLIRDLAGGALIMLPSSFRDWTNPALAAIIRKSQRSPNFSSDRKVIKLLKAAWDAIGSEFASPRHMQGRNVLCRRPVRHHCPQLPHVRLGPGVWHGHRSIAINLMTSEPDVAAACERQAKPTGGAGFPRCGFTEHLGPSLPYWEF